MRNEAIAHFEIKWIQDFPWDAALAFPFISSVPFDKIPAKTVAA
jgi:hypothetical protein